MTPTQFTALANAWATCQHVINSSRDLVEVRRAVAAQVEVDLEMEGATA